MLRTEIQHSFNANNNAIEDERQSGAIGYAVGALKEPEMGKSWP